MSRSDAGEESHDMRPVPHNPHQATESSRLKIARKTAVFLVQFVISLSVVFFCMFQLSQGYNCERESAFIALLSATVAYWLPAPRPLHLGHGD